MTVTRTVLNQRPELFPYQETGAEWLKSRKVALLADDMGLGKTAQAIIAADRAGLERVFVIGPAIARLTWLREFSRFSDRKRNFVVVDSKNFEIAPTDSVICSYDLVACVLARLPRDARFDLLIGDEWHYLKSPTAVRTKSVLGTDGLIHRCKRTWALSGTPAPSHAGELWVTLFTFGITKLKYDDFVRTFCTGYPNPHDRTKLQITGTKPIAIPHLKELLSKIMLRRKKEEVLTQLPRLTFSDLVVPPGPVDLEVCDSFIKYVFPVDRREELKQTLAMQNQLATSALEKTGYGSNEGIRLMEALAKSVSTLRRYTGLQKLEPVADMIAEELESGAYQKIVIFAIHKDVIEGLRVRLRKFKPVCVYGGSDPDTRQRNIDNFQTKKNYRVFIGNIQAAGTNITLTAADQVLFIEQDWVPGNNAQAVMRVHRIGQTKPVWVRFVGLENSIDQKVSLVLRTKAAQLTAIFDN